MPKFKVWGEVSGKMYLGTYEAESAEAALELADEQALEKRLCSRCFERCEDLTVEAMDTEEVKA